MNRFIFFIYYLANTKPGKFLPLLNFAGNNNLYASSILLMDDLFSTFRYNISLLDYFYFRFYEKDKKERQKWAGTGFMYEYQLQMNPKKSRRVLIHKILFLHHYKAFVKRNFLSFHEMQHDNNSILHLLENPSGRIVLKGSHGQAGAQVEVVKAGDFNPATLLIYMAKNKYDLAEEYVVQHPALSELSPSGLNTIRIFTQLHQGAVDLLGARLRISVNSPVDNMAAGNLAAVVNTETGIVEGSAVYSDITKPEETIHPVTGKAITGFQVPFWKETVQMAREAALLIPENRSVGWDIAITDEGPELIEGNHNWCKLLWQLPAKQGLKHLLEPYLL
jgi:hypothetical protein